MERLSTLFANLRCVLFIRTNIHVVIMNILSLETLFVQESILTIVNKVKFAMYLLVKSFHICKWKKDTLYVISIVFRCILC